MPSRPAATTPAPGGRPGKSRCRDACYRPWLPEDTFLAALSAQVPGMSLVAVDAGMGLAGPHLDFLLGGQGLEVRCACRFRAEDASLNVTMALVPHRGTQLSEEIGCATFNLRLARERAATPHTQVAALVRPGAYAAACEASPASGWPRRLLEGLRDVCAAPGGRVVSFALDREETLKLLSLFDVDLAREVLDLLGLVSSVSKFIFRHDPGATNYVVRVKGGSHTAPLRAAEFWEETVAGLTSGFTFGADLTVEQPD